MEKTDSLLIGVCVSTKDGKKIGQIIAIDKSHMMVKDSQKTLRKLEGLSYSIARIKDWQYRLVKGLLKETYYYIPLTEAKLKDWQYRD